MSASRIEKVVVVGNGMAGIAFVENLLKHGRPFDITVFGDEIIAVCVAPDTATPAQERAA